MESVEKGIKVLDREFGRGRKEFGGMLYLCLHQKLEVHLDCDFILCLFDMELVIYGYLCVLENEKYFYDGVFDGKRNGHHHHPCTTPRGIVCGPPNTDLIFMFIIDY